MERHLTIWSTRSLTLLGKILILKTFAFSQAIYLLQSMCINDLSLKRINKLVFKFLWNKNFAALKAPDRIKRSVMMTPIDLGGFGMMDLKEVADSLDFRSYGRLIVSEHPFFFFKDAFYSYANNTNSKYELHLSDCICNKILSRTIMYRIIPQVQKSSSIRCSISTDRHASHGSPLVWIIPRDNV